MSRRWAIGIGLMVVVLVMTGGCVRRPKNVMSKSRTAAVIADMELAEAYLQSNPQQGNQTEIRARITAGVLERHGVSRQVFDSTMSWYGHNIDEYYKLDSEINRKLAARRQSLAKQGGGVVEQQTAINDLWPYKRTAVIWEKSGSNVLEFSLPVAEIEKGASMEWSLKLHSPVESEMLLGIEYRNGMISYVSRSASTQKTIETSVQTDTALTVKRIFGHFSVKKSNDLPVFMDSIILRPMPLDTNQYYRVHSQKKIYPPSRPKVVQPDSI